MSDNLNALDGVVYTIMFESSDSSEAIISNSVFTSIQTIEFIENDISIPRVSRKVGQEFSWGRYWCSGQSTTILGNGEVDCVAE